MTSRLTGLRDDEYAVGIGMYVSKAGVGERVLCGNGNLANLIDFSEFAIQLPDSTIESAESLCLASI